MITNNLLTQTSILLPHSLETGISPELIITRYQVLVVAHFEFIVKPRTRGTVHLDGA